MRKLKANISDIADVQEVNSPEISHFLDLETGEVVMVTEEDNSAIEDFYEQVDLQDDESEEVIQAKFEEWLDEYDCPEWQKDSIRPAFMVERNAGERYIQIPESDSHDGYNDMVGFTATVKDEHLQNLLSVALNGKGAFRRFKDVLYKYPEEQERWFKHSREQTEQRVREWLESEDIEIES